MFDDNLREAFQRETELFLESTFQEDRPLPELLTARYTFLNERLAAHYGIPGVYGSHFRRVELSAARRGYFDFVRAVVAVDTGGVSGPFRNRPCHPHS